MKYIPRFANNLFKVLFGNAVGNKIKCFYYAHFKNGDFAVHFENNCFNIVLKNGIDLKLHHDPFGDLSNIMNGYCRNYNLKRGDYVIDAGSYVGVTAIYFSKMIGEAGKVIAFEPDDCNYNKLLKNIKLNKLNNVIAINKGLWDKNEVLLFDNRKDEDSAIVKCLNERVKGTLKKYEFARLDDELTSLGIDKVDFVKMDIEGAEIEALEGCKRTLEKNEVNLAVASYHLRNGEKTCKKLESFFKSIGYEAKTEYPEHLTTFARKK